jgi:hypothetical protein
MQQAIGASFGIVCAGLLFVAGYATLLQPRENLTRFPFPIVGGIVQRIHAAFGADTTFKFVRFAAIDMMVCGVLVLVAAGWALFNQLIKL